jgi:hypothetical protein
VLASAPTKQSRSVHMEVLGDEVPVEVKVSAVRGGKLLCAETVVSSADRSALAAA